ncbi:hypothetical protein THTE_2036 [Thermogutta terrifontis]|uniref:Uncharacterized protein n=1 Tax=Thermogutta terrifontis TaxID=1331910 RepID=A0A286RFA9_9BACT|nr:hypothetical protein THTE_2036 [Thermogutta terrifontis]
MTLLPRDPSEWEMVISELGTEPVPAGWTPAVNDHSLR